MFLSADLLNLLLYCVQQFGVALGFGSATILLIAYLIAMRDRTVDAKEAQYYRAVRGALNFGLLFIILSGVGITVFHIMAAQEDVLLAPAFLFKWLLILLALTLTIVARKKEQWVTEGLSGGTWYALFLVHILAPVTGWLNLITLYAVWMAGFMLCWTALVFLMREKKKEPSPVEKLLPKINKIEPRTFTPPPAAHPPLGKPLPPPPPPPQPAPKPAPPVAVPPPNPAPQKSSDLLAKSSARLFAGQGSAPVPTPPMPPAPLLPPIVPVKLAPKEVPLQKPEELKPEPATTADPDQHPGLPAIRVMPKTPADIATSERATFVKLEQDISTAPPAKASGPN